MVVTTVMSGFRIEDWRNNYLFTTNKRSAYIIAGARMDLGAHDDVRLGRSGMVRTSFSVYCPGARNRLFGRHLQFTTICTIYVHFLFHHRKIVNVWGSRGGMIYRGIIWGSIVLHLYLLYTRLHIRVIMLNHATRVSREVHGVLYLSIYYCLIRNVKSKVHTAQPCTTHVPMGLTWYCGAYPGI